MRFTYRAFAALMAVILYAFGSPVSFSPFASCAIAEEGAPELEIAVIAAPDAFVVPGETALTFTLTNPTKELLESVCLTSPDGQLMETIGNIAPGEIQTYSRTHMLTQAELDAGVIEYIVTCVVGSDHFSYPISTPIQKNSAEPEVEFLRQISTLDVSDGNAATVVYQVRNVGYVPIIALTVADALGDYEAQLEILPAGEEKRFLQRVSVSDESISAPTLTYSTESNSDAYTTSLDPMTLRAVNSSLDASITAGRSMFTSDTAEVILRMTNSGDVDYQSITIYDDIYGGIIDDSIHLPVGSKPLEVSHAYPLRENSSYRWRITGRTPAGEQIDFVTNTVTVEPDAEKGEPLLSVRASTSMPHINRRGYVPVRLELTNIGDSMATDVRISEESAGEIYKLAVVPTGEPTVCEIRLPIRENTELIFSASYADSFGKERIATADPVEISIGPGGQRPETDEQYNSIFGGIATQMQNSGLFMGLLIGCCVVLVVLIIVLVITSRRARIQRKAKASARKQRIKEDMAKTARFKPIRRRNDAKTDTKK